MEDKVARAVERGSRPKIENQNWNRLIPKVRNCLTQLSFRGYEHAAPLQQALLYTELAIIRAGGGEEGEAWNYLALAARSANEAVYRSQEPKMIQRLSMDDRFKRHSSALGRAIAYVTFAIQSSESYLNKPVPAKLERARLRLEDAATTIAGTLLLE